MGQLAKICNGEPPGSGLRKYARRQNHTIPVCAQAMHPQRARARNTAPQSSHVAGISRPGYHSGWDDIFAKNSEIGDIAVHRRDFIETIFRGYLERHRTAHAGDIRLVKSLISTPLPLNIDTFLENQGSERHTAVQHGPTGHKVTHKLTRESECLRLYTPCPGRGGACRARRVVRYTWQGLGRTATRQGRLRLRRARHDRRRRRHCPFFWCMLYGELPAILGRRATL